MSTELNQWPERESEEETVPADDALCPICFGDRKNEWVILPCRQRLCRACLERLVLSCPEGIKSLHSPALVVFDSDRDPTHCHKCPFCKDAYMPRTKVRHFLQNSGAAVREVEVGSLVKYPYAYQTFDNDMVECVLTAREYAIVQKLYKLYLDRQRAERSRDSGENSSRLRRPRLPAEEVTVLLDSVSNENYGRLQFLRQGGFGHYDFSHFEFDQAVSFLHRRRLDGGFLGRVASLNEGQRIALVREAYEVGWNQPAYSPSGRPNHGLVNASFVTNLLRHNGLVDFIYISDDSDSSDGDDGP